MTRALDPGGSGTRKGASSITDALKAVQGIGGSGGLLTAGPSPTSLAAMLENQAVGQDQQVARNGGISGLGVTDPFTALQQQLFGSVNNINIAPTPLDQLRQIAQQQVSAQYDPQIAALGNEIKVHTNRAHKSEKTARDMYGSLAQDYLSQLPDITAQYKAQDDATNQRYAQAQQQAGDQYKQNASQQDALLKQLGIQAAAPQADQQAANDQAYFQNQSKMDQQNALNALAQQQQAQSDYTQNLSNTARFAGENTAQGIDQQLSDYLDQATSQSDALTSAKSQAIAALVSQLQQQDQQRIQTQGQQQFDNMLKLYQFQLDAQNSALKAQQGNGAGGFGSGTGNSSLTTGIPGAQNYLASQFPTQPVHASQLMQLLNNVLSDPTVKKGKFILEPGDQLHGPKYSNVGQQYVEGLLRKEAEGSQYNSPQDINSLLAALEAYFGKLR